MENDVIEYIEKVGDLLTQEMLDDINLRFGALSLLKEKEIEKFSLLSRSDKQKKYNGVVERIAKIKGLEKKDVVRKIYIDILTNVYGADSEQLKRAQKIINDDDEIKLDIWIANEVSKLDPQTRAEQEDKVLTPKVFVTSLLNGAPEILDAQTDRYVEVDEQPARKYCLRATTLSLHKQNKEHGLYDFLPEEINNSISNKAFIAHIKENYPDTIFNVGKFENVGDFIDSIGIKPGALVILEKKEEASLHALIYTHKKNGEHYTTSFNPELKERKASHFNNAIIVDIPELIASSILFKIEDKTKEEQIEFLQNLEQKITAKSIVDKNFADVLDEGKKYSPKEQWEAYYKRCDIVFDTQKRVEAQKLILQKRRER